MVTTVQSQSEILIYIFVILVIFILSGCYGRQVMKWLLTRLYDFFIQNNPMKL